MRSHCRLALALALALGAGPRFHQLLGIGALPVAMAAVVTSQTRAAVLAAAVGVAAFLALGAVERRGGKILAGAVVASALTVLFFGLLFKGSIDLERFDSIAPSRLFSTFEGERRSALTVLPDYIARYPFGAGLGSVGSAAGSRTASENTGELADENLFVFLVVELGIAGLLLVLVLLAATLRRGILATRRVRDPAPGLLLAAITVRDRDPLARRRHHGGAPWRAVLLACDRHHRAMVVVGGCGGRCTDNRAGQSGYAEARARSRLGYAAK